MQTEPSASQDAPLAPPPLNTHVPVSVLHESTVQALPSLQTVAGPETHAPPLHLSPLVQALPSLQLLVLAVCVQPVVGLQESLVQALPSSQLMAAPATQFAPVQTSGLVHTLLSALQICPWLIGLYWQPPLFGLHVFCRQMVSADESQNTTVAGLIAHLYGALDLSQNSVPLHLSLSFKGAQSASAWHAQVLVPDLHTPAAHVSPVVHGLPSSQAVVLLVCTQPVALLQLSVVQTLLSLQNTAGLNALPAQVPAPQTSPVVQALLSLHARLLMANTQPEPGLQLSVVHRLLSLQVMPVPAQAFAAQMSPLVQALPSSQIAALAVFRQPVTALQESVVHGLPSLQLSEPPDVHRPPEQVSPVVQALPSVQGTLLAVYLQPVAATQASSVQVLPSLHVMAVPRQAPAAHLSAEVQALPSSQAATELANTQLPLAASQESDVHGLESLQFLTAPGTQPEAAQMSPTVQGLPSEQGLALAVCVQPVTGLQLSSVQALLSLQLTCGPGRHTPALQASPTEHTELSALHGAFWFCAM